MPHHDDLTHANIGKMIIVLKDWFTMHEGKNISFLKPPLYFWLEAIFFKFFGVNDFFARLPSVICGFLTGVFTYLIALKLFNKKIAVASLLILSTSYYFIKLSRSAMLDIPVTMTTIISIYFFTKYEFDNSRKNIYLFSIFVAMGYYFKAIQGLYPLFIIPVYYILTKNFKKIFKPDLIISYSLTFFLIALWAYPNILKYGESFIYSQSFIGPIIKRGVEHAYGNKFYNPFIKLLGLNFPWGILGFFALFSVIKNYLNTKDKNLLILLSSFFTILLIISYSKTFYIRYLMPLIPFFSIIIGIFILHTLKINYLLFKKLTFTFLFLYFLKISIFPVKPMDMKGTEYYNLFTNLKLLQEIDKNNIVIYKEKYYKLNQGLSYYSDIFPKRYISTEEELLKTKDKNEYYITNYKSLEELLKNNINIKVILSEKDKWAIFRFEN